MVLRKPFALMIKHFKLIHLILLGLIAFILFNSGKLLSFYNLLIDNNYSIREAWSASTYFSGWIVLSFILIIFILISLICLLINKRKDSKFYWLFLIFYIFLFALSFVSNSSLLELENTMVESSIIRGLRDVVNITYYPQFFVFVFVLIKAIGFDVKTFSFSPDIDDFDILDSDNEEIDVSINVDGYLVKRNIRKTKRELKYYVLENKFIFGLILLGILLFSLVGLYTDFTIYNKSYRVNETFNHDSFNITFKESYLTNKSYDGTIVQDGKMFLAVVVNVVNNHYMDRVLDATDFKLVIGNKNIDPVLDRSGHFVDIATPYYGDIISSGINYNFVLVYELLENQQFSSYDIRILDGVVVEDGELTPMYKKIKVKPTLQLSNYKVDSLGIKDEVVFEKSTLGNTSLTISDFEIVNKYEYNYNYCYREECTLSKASIIIDQQKYLNQTLMVLDSKLLLDKDTYYASDANTSHNFYNEFVKINYVINGKSYVSKVTDVTPKVVKNDVILRISKNVMNAEEINAVVTIRNMTYIIKLRG